MRRPTKKTTKKKVATKPRPVTADVAATEFDDWAEHQRKRRTGCVTCRDELVSETIRALLLSLIRKRAFKFSVHDLRIVIEKKHPDANVGQRGLERHLRTCERTLYFRARGHRNV